MQAAYPNGKIYIYSPFYCTFILVSLSHQKELKEEPHMKTAVMKRKVYVPLPGAATRREIFHKYLDKLLLIASAFGFFVGVMFLLTLA